MNYPLDNHQNIEALLKHAKASQSAARIEAIPRLASGSLLCSLNEFDSNPYLLNLINGTYDLKSEVFKPHDQSDLLTKCAPVIYDEKATCSRWLDYLRETFEDNVEIISFLQRWVGYCLTGDTSEQKLLIFMGVGANGKSVFCETLSRLLGDYAGVTEFTSLLADNQKGVRNDIAGLKGLRIVTAHEPPSGKHLDEAIIKLLTGQDRIKARFLHHEFFEFAPTFKFILSTNHTIPISGGDYGIWRRIMILRFNKIVPPEKQDKYLVEKLTEPSELSGILNWAIEGYRNWKAQGLNPPPEIVSETASLRVEMDSIQNFIDQSCRVGAGEKESIFALYNNFVNWCAGENEQLISQRAFGLKLSEKGFKASKDSHGTRVRLGLSLIYK